MICTIMKKPFYRKREQCWFVWVNSKTQIRLDPDERKAYDLWSRMVAAGTSKGPLATVGGILDDWLDEHAGTVSKARHEVLVRYGSMFWESHGADLANDMRVATVKAWLDAPKPMRKRKVVKDGEEVLEDVMGEWSDGTKRHAAAFLKRVWKWAHASGHINKNMLSGLKLPPVRYRDTIIDAATHRRIIEHLRKTAEARPFALYLIASRCGARPQQIREVTAANVSADGMRWHFKKHKTADKTNRGLDVYLHPCLQTITRILAAARPTGSLFRNNDGKPWTKSTVVTRMRRLRERLDLPPGTIAYSYRHAFATQALLSGASTAIVAQLLGHVDTRMVVQAYSHLEQSPQHLVEAAAKAVRVAGQ